MNPTLTEPRISLSSRDRYHQLNVLKVVATSHHQRIGRPRRAETPSRYTYRIQATLVPNPEAIEAERTIAGRFLLATNVLDSTTLSADQALQEYKDQQANERGFRFLKDPLFFTSSVFLKSPQRVMAVAMVMALSLLVYSLAQRKLRHALEAADTAINNQLGKPTNASYAALLCFSAFKRFIYYWLMASSKSQI